MAKVPSTPGSNSEDKSAKPRAQPRREMAAHRVQEDLVRQKLEDTPVLRQKSTSDYQLPDLAAPSLEDLTVTLDALPDITEEEIIARFDAELRSASPKRERSAEESVEEDDDVLVDWLAYADGQLLPFSPRSHIPMVIRPNPLLPGLTEALVGVKVGDGKTIPIVLPEDYPIEAYRNKEANFVVDIRAAFEVDVLDQEDAAALAHLGRGDTIDEVIDSIAEEIEGERADELFLLAQEKVLDELCARVTIDIPTELIDDEIHLQWKAIEAPVVQMKDFTVAEQKESLNTWQTDAATRFEAERRIKIGLIFKALIESENIEPDEEILEMIMASSEESLELDRSEIKDAMLQDQNATEAVAGTAYHMAALEYVMARANILFPEDDDGNE
jgi:trigger factor